MQDDAELYGYLDDFEGAKVNTDYKYASIFVGTFTKGKMLNGYDCQILVQIGGVKEKPKNNGIFTLTLADGTEIYPKEVPVSQPFTVKGGTDPYVLPDDLLYW